MANENLKKFLDSAGVSHLWTKIDSKIKEEVNKEAARVDAKIGVVPKNAEGNDRTVVKYIEDLTDGLVTDGVISELQKDVGKNKEDIAALQEAAGDYATKSQLENYETITNANKIREDLAQYKEDNDAALEIVKGTADNAAAKTYVDEQLRGKASQDEFVEIQTLVNHFFAEESDVAKKLDQLVEIVEYLNTHEGTAADIVEDLAGLQTKVNNLLNMGSNADGEEYTVPTYVHDKINERLNIGNKTVKSYVEDLLGITGQTVKDYVDTSIQSFVDGDYAQTVTNIGKLAERVGTLEEAIEAIQEVLEAGYITQSDMETYVNGRLGEMKDSDGKTITVVEYINALALTNEEINVAIGATQQTN